MKLELEDDEAGVVVSVSGLMAKPEDARHAKTMSKAILRRATEGSQFPEFGIIT